MINGLILESFFKTPNERRSGMRQNDRKPWEQFTVCICDKCGEAYEPDREHVCRKKNSYPGAEKKSP